MAMFEKAEDEYNDLLSKKNIIENDKSKMKKVNEELDEKKKKILKVTWVKVNKNQYPSNIEELALSHMKTQADKLNKSLENEIHFLKGRVLELESDLVSKSTEVTSAVSGKEEALSSAFTEIDRLKEENFVKT
ncbi:nuclear-pore anchor-like [Magnolia sinica]|uniref:nuclear-pore anchor-like n=1 Tax=Magnolia sinica TaxID=86752 RepID=UPI002657E342|nr:nuclear-pore anchor-like [Magnolia sinica]XP_058071670.1 nuclear-pore anchor-like [Magnolia sinica]